MAAAQNLNYCCFMTEIVRGGAVTWIDMGLLHAFPIGQLLCLFVLHVHSIFCRFTPLKLKRLDGNDSRQDLN